MSAHLPTPRCCVKPRRYEDQDGWRLMQILSNSSGIITVSGRNVNTFHTFIDVFAFRNSDSTMTSKLLYSKEFEEYSSEGIIYWYRYASVVKPDCDKIVSCIGDKLEIIQVSYDDVLRSRKMEGEARCMCVRESEIFIGSKESNKIMVYDIIQLHEIRMITLQGIQDGIDWPFEMTVASDKIFVCVGRDNPESYHRSLVFQETSGTILSELTYPSTLRFYAWSITANLKSGLVAVVWLEKYSNDGKTQIVLYSLSENSAFLTTEVESSLLRIRISEDCDTMITGNHVTGELNIYDMADFFTYNNLKEQIASHFKTDDFVKLTNFFCLPKRKTDAILKSDAPVENFLFALEEQGVILPSNVDRLAEAFLELRSPCSQLTEIYQKTRTSAYYKETIQKLRDEIQRLHEDKQKMDKLETVVHRAEGTDTRMQNVQEILRKAGICLHDTNLRNTLRSGQLEQCLLQLLNLQPEKQLQLSTQTQTKKLFQNTLDGRYEVKAEQDQIQAQSCTATSRLREVSGSERHAEVEKTTSLVVNSCACASVSLDVNEYFSESAIEGEFSKLLVKVAVKLTTTHCLLLANYFNFPASKIDLIRKDTETPGITLFGVMKERNVINMYDVINLQQAFVDLELKEINETLLKPYQSRIGPSKCSQHRTEKQEY